MASRPLAGVPFGVKDIEDIAGLPTTQGSLLYKDVPPAAQDWPHVEKLRAAGAIAVGKTNMCEFGVDSSSYNRLWGVTRNPWNLALTPGGSSGGASAAVAAGIVPLATATDAAGSIRCPAWFTGLVGLKPSHGRIAKNDGFANWATHGAVTHTVADTVRYLDAVAGPDDRDRQSLPHAGYRCEDVIETLDVACVPYGADDLMPETIDGRDASKTGTQPFGFLANIGWHPAISVPAGVTRAGLPVGLQVMVRRHRDDVALRLARLLEIARPWGFPWTHFG